MQVFPVIGFHILVERIEAGSNRTVLSNQFDIGTNSVRQSHFFRPCGCFIVPFPQGQDKRFDTFLFLDVLEPYYKGGEYDYLLNSDKELDLLHKRFIVFELDNIKDHKILFPITTIIIMEVFINKMRKLKGIRKLILIEEAWKAIASANMADYIKYLYKTVRKYFGEAIVVTQEVEDIISSPIVKESIINKSSSLSEFSR